MTLYKFIYHLQLIRDLYSQSNTTEICNNNIIADLRMNSTQKNSTTVTILNNQTKIHSLYINTKKNKINSTNFWGSSQFYKLTLFNLTKQTIQLKLQSNWMIPVWKKGSKQYYHCITDWSTNNFVDWHKKWEIKIKIRWSRLG